MSLSQLRRKLRLERGQTTTEYILIIGFIVLVVLGIVFMFKDPLIEFVTKILDKIGIRDCFKQVFVSAELGVRKPDGRFLDWVLDSTGVDPGQAVIIGDRLTQDIRMANESDMASVYCSMVEHDDNTGAEDTPYTAVVGSLNKLLQVFPRRASARQAHRS